MNVSLHQLRAFEAVVRFGSQTKAADELGLRPATVSTQVADLERFLGLDLFERIQGRLRPTEAGQELWEYAHEVVAAANDGVVAMDEWAGRGPRELRIVADSTVGVYVVPRLLGALRSRHPEMRVAEEILNRTGVGTRLLAGEADLAIMGQPPESDRLVVLPFLGNQLAVIASPHHELAGAGQVPLARLADELFVLREAGSGTRAALTALFASHQLSPRVALELGHNGAVKQSVAAGLGLGVMSTVAVVREIRFGRLVVIDAEHFPLQRHWYLVHLRQRRLPSSAAAFCRFAQEWAQEAYPAQARVES